MNLSFNFCLTVITLSRLFIALNGQASPESTIDAQSTFETDIASTINTNSELSEEENAINPTPYQWIINQPDICHRRDPFMVTFVHTAPMHYRHRQTIRNTWGNPKFNRQLNNFVIFVIGDTRNQTLNNMIVLENDRNRDIIQADFIDSYRNLTIKHIMWIKWAYQYCPQAKYYMKTDDDVFLNIFALENHIKQLDSRGIIGEKTIMCNVFYKAKVQRSLKSKWFVSVNEYRARVYPAHCPGIAYIMTSDLAKPLYKKALNTKFFWIDDVYITGIVARELGVTHHKMNSIYVFNKKLLQRRNERGIMVFGLTDSIDLNLSLWKHMLRVYKKDTT